MKTYNLLTGLSDHNLVLTARKLTKRLQQFKNQRPIRLKFGISKSRVSPFELEMNHVDWGNILHLNEVNQCCTSLTENSTNLLNMYTSQKSSRKRISLPWLNSDIRNLMKRRDKVLKNALSSKLNTDNLIYKCLRNKVVQELWKSKLYYTQLIESARGQSTVLWKQIRLKINIVKELYLNGKVINDKVTLADEFNTYFIQSVDELAQSFKLTALENSVEVEAIHSLTSFCIKEIDENKITEIIKIIPNSRMFLI